MVQTKIGGKEAANVHKKTKYLQVYGAMEALGRVQNYILASSRHPVEQADTNRSLAKALVQTEAQLLAAQDKIEELTKLLMNSKTPGG